MRSMNLQAFGVSDDCLTDDQRTQLDEQGFLVLGQLLSDQELAAIREQTDALTISEGESAGSELFTSPHIRHPKESGALRLADLVNKGAVFDRFYTHPQVLAGVQRVIQDDFRLSSLNYRSALPGNGAQKLHVDWRTAVAPNAFRVCNSIWLLDDFSAANGATRFVPGSHLSGKLPEELMTNPEDPHPHEQLLEAPAGTVAIFNAHLWHGGTLNQSPHPRRAIHAYFCRHDEPQQLDQKRYLRPQTAERLSAATLKILGV